MPAKLTVILSEDQRQELEKARDHHAKAYVREAAAAILKVAAGLSARQVASQGLLKERDPETVSDWIRRYQAEGLAGLQVRAGRGRKAVFFPSEPATSRQAGAGSDWSESAATRVVPQSLVVGRDSTSDGLFGGT
jgi:plasmid stabilization system protein ParE